MTTDIPMMAPQVGLTDGVAQFILCRMSKIFTIWETAADLARDIGESPTTVRNWFNRNSIPMTGGLKVVQAGRKRGIEITVDMLADPASARKSGNPDCLNEQVPNGVTPNPAC